MRTLAAIGMIAAAALAVHSSYADEAAPVDAADEATASTGTDDADTLIELSASDATLTEEELGMHRAREAISVKTVTVNDQQQDGTVSDNVAFGNHNGDNLINGNAFSDSSGFMSTVQNTGNNVLIQNSTIINVSVDAAAPTN